MKTYFMILTLTLFIAYPAYASSTRGHMILMSKELGEVVFSPIAGVLFNAPKNIKNAWQYEVWGREKPEDRGLFRYKVFSLWRAPGEAGKGIIDGVVESVKSLGDFSKEFISIFFGD